jgi:hypothetical protein
LLILIAHTPEFMSWKYATPPTITGVDEKLPNVPDLPVIGTVQAIPSLEALDELIDDLTSRVPARLPLYWVHAAATGEVVVEPLDGEVVIPVEVAVPVDVLDDEADDDVAGAADDDDDDDVDEDDFFELPPHPASSTKAATTGTSTPRT